MKIPLLIIAGVLLVAAVGYHLYEPKIQKEYSEQQKAAILSFLEKGSKLKTLTTQGVNFNTFNTELASVLANWDTLKNTNWPSSSTFTREREIIEVALAGWSIAQWDWKAKNDGVHRYTNINDQYRNWNTEFNVYFFFNDSAYNKRLESERDDPDSVGLILSGADKAFSQAKQRLYSKLQ
jgi:hypothetical protein